MHRNQILRYTEADHADFVSLTQSLKVAESILVATNEAIRALENAEKLIALSENLEFDGVEGVRLSFFSLLAHAD